MQTVELLEYGHRIVLQTTDGLSEADWNTPGVCGVWSVKDIIAHLASHEWVLVDALSSLLDERSLTPHLAVMMEQGDQFNDAQVDARKDMSAADVLREYTDAYTQAHALITRLPAAMYGRAGTLPWYGEQYALDDLIVYGYHGHKREHAAQIGVFRDRLAR